MLPISASTPPSPIPPYLEGEFFRRISDVSKQQIASATAELFPTTQQIAELKSRDYSQPVFKEENWLYLAIKAYANRHLEEHILAHLFLYDTCKRWSNFQCFTASPPPPGSWRSRHFLHTTEEAWAETLKTSFPNYMWHTNWMNQAIDEVVKSDLPKEDRQIFQYVLDNTAHSHEKELLKHFTSYVTAFMPIKSPYGMVIIPPRLFYALLKARFKENAITPHPVLGYSTTERFSDPTIRVMSIQHPELAPIDTPIHGYCHAKESALFYFHDMYHLIIESANPYRDIFVGIFRYLNRLSKRDPLLKDSQCFQSYKSNALDRDFPSLVRPWVEKMSISLRETIELLLGYYSRELKHFKLALSEKESSTMNQLKKLIRDYVEDNHFLQLLELPD